MLPLPRVGKSAERSLAVPPDRPYNPFTTRKRRVYPTASGSHQEGRCPPVVGPSTTILGHHDAEQVPIVFPRGGTVSPHGLLVLMKAQAPSMLNIWRQWINRRSSSSRPGRRSAKRPGVRLELV